MATFQDNLRYPVPCRKVKLVWIWMRQEMMGFWDAVASAGSWTICTSLPTDNQTNTSSLSFLQAACSSWHPTNSVKAPKAKMITMITVTKISNYTVPGKNDTPIKIALSILSQILWTKTMKHINKDWHIFMSILLAFKRPVCHWKYEISNTVTLVWSMFFKQVIAKRIDL